MDDVAEPDSEPGPRPTSRPCDLTKLRKGSYLPPSYLAHRLGEVVGTKPYRFAVMELVTRIRSERPDLAAHIRFDDEGLRVMEDLEAHYYGCRRMVNRARASHRDAKARASIVRSDFSDSDKRHAENADRVATEIAKFARKTIRAARLQRLFDGELETGEELGDDEP